MIVEANHNARRLKIICQSPDEALDLKGEYMFLYSSTDGELSHKYLQWFTLLSHKKRDLTFSGEEFDGVRREISEALMAAYITVPNVVPQIPIIDFLGIHFFVVPVAPQQFKLHSKTMEVSFERQVDTLVLEPRAKDE